MGNLPDLKMMSGTDWIEGIIREQKAAFEARHGRREMERETFAVGVQPPADESEKKTTKKTGKDYNKAWREKNREKKKQYDAEYRAANMDKIRKQRQEYYQKHRAELLEKSKARNAAKRAAEKEGQNEA